MGILTVYQAYVEKNCFYQAVETDGKVKRSWKWSSEFVGYVLFCIFFSFCGRWFFNYIFYSYDDKYHLTAEYSNMSRSGRAVSVKSIGAFIDYDGEVLFFATFIYNYYNLGCVATVAQGS